jgi:hypothetical protein
MSGIVTRGPSDVVSVRDRHHDGRTLAAGHAQVARQDGVDAVAGVIDGDGAADEIAARLSFRQRLNRDGKLVEGPTGSPERRCDVNRGSGRRVPAGVQGIEG